MSTQSRRGGTPKVRTFKLTFNNDTLVHTEGDFFAQDPQQLIKESKKYSLLSGQRRRQRQEQGGEAKKDDGGRRRNSPQETPASTRDGMDLSPTRRCVKPQRLRRRRASMGSSTSGR